jgi:hypothetical protein
LLRTSSLLISLFGCIPSNLLTASAFWLDLTKWEPISHWRFLGGNQVIIPPLFNSFSVLYSSVFCCSFAVWPCSFASSSCRSFASCSRRSFASCSRSSASSYWCSLCLDSSMSSTITIILLTCSSSSSQSCTSAVSSKISYSGSSP